ncbi:hypothetical protein ABT001_01255 [Streptomyces sp. NPDC002793]|uniref:hypothetical protein n=1 Tax=Streptomyces sp. NPDC002793 TaxID=3154432 RepID=UPI00332A61EB
MASHTRRRCSDTCSDTHVAPGGTTPRHTVPTPLDFAVDPMDQPEVNSCAHEDTEVTVIVIHLGRIG